MISTYRYQLKSLFYVLGSSRHKLQEELWRQQMGVQEIRTEKNVQNYDGMKINFEEVKNSHTINNQLPYNL